MGAWRFSTIDEMMVCYKGTYCPACQYMPKNHKNEGSKFGVWPILTRSMFTILTYIVRKTWKAKVGLEGAWQNQQWHMEW